MNVTWTIYFITCDEALASCWCFYCWWNGWLRFMLVLSFFFFFLALLMLLLLFYTSLARFSLFSFSFNIYISLLPSKSRFWASEEYNKLVESLVLYNDGKFEVDNNFKSGSLGAFENTLETKINGCSIKTKPYIESNTKTLMMQF